MLVKNDRRLSEIWPAGPPSRSVEIDGQSFVLVAGTLLRGHDPDALTVDGGTPPRMVGGYSILSRALEASEPYRFLFQRAESLSVPSPPLPSGAPLGELLRRFRETGFGHALVAFPSGPTMVSLSQVLNLYREDRLDTPLSCHEVASPLVPPISQGATLEEAARAMMKHRVRRLLVEGEARTVITDRLLIDVLTSKEAIEWIGDHPGRLPPLTVASLRPVPLVEVEGSLRVPEAARRFDPSTGAALGCEKGIVTPWDLVMKPFERDALSLRGRSQPAGS